MFLIDADFTIERPNRAYRTGLHFMTGHANVRSIRKGGEPVSHPEDNDIDLDNPFAQEMIIANGEGQGDKGQTLHDDGEEHHASQHTFYIINSQRRLKLVAKNAVSPSFYSKIKCVRHKVGTDDGGV